VIVKSNADTSLGAVHGSSTLANRTSMEHLLRHCFVIFMECFNNLNDLLQWVFLDVKNSALGGKTTQVLSEEEIFLLQD